MTQRITLQLFNKQTAALAFVVIWLSIVIVAFWYSQIKPLRLFDNNGQLAYFVEQTSISQLAEQISIISELNAPTDRLAIIHFYSDNCHCNKIPQAHIKQLNQQGKSRNYSTHFVIDQQADSVKINQTYQPDRIITTGQLKQQRWLPATPAVAILNHGKIAYFGPYSGGSFCGPANSYVELVLKSINNGQSPSLVNMMESGCYCSNTKTS